MPSPTQKPGLIRQTVILPLNLKRDLDYLPLPLLKEYIQPEMVKGISVELYRLKWPSGIQSLTLNRAALLVVDASGQQIPGAIHLKHPGMSISPTGDIQTLPPLTWPTNQAAITLNTNSGNLAFSSASTTSIASRNAIGRVPAHRPQPPRYNLLADWSLVIKGGDGFQRVDNVFLLFEYDIVHAQTVLSPDEQYLYGIKKKDEACYGTISLQTEAYHKAKATLTDAKNRGLVDQESYIMSEGTTYTSGPAANIDSASDVVP